MVSLTCGTIPADLVIDVPYPMELTATDEQAVCVVINQGIDAHLEAVFFTDLGVQGNKRHVQIDDSKSMRCFLRRCAESDDENTQDLASCIMQTLGYEWI